MKRRRQSKNVEDRRNEITPPEHNGGSPFQQAAHVAAKGIQNRSTAKVKSPFSTAAGMEKAAKTSRIIDRGRWSEQNRHWTKNNKKQDRPTKMDAKKAKALKPYHP